MFIRIISLKKSDINMRKNIDMQMIMSFTEESHRNKHLKNILA